MARIRTVKPEAFVSESLAEVTVEAERTFFGLLTQADDHGRHRDNAAIIAGLLWPLRAEHTSVHVEDDLTQLAEAGLICRYTGCDGRRYLHVVTWYEHQKIDRPSQSRMPSCPRHHAEQRCGACKGVCGRRAEASPEAPRTVDETSSRTPRSLDQSDTHRADDHTRHHDEPATRPGNSSTPGTAGVGPLGNETADHGPFADASTNPRDSLGEPSAPGSRILDPGPSSPSGREAPDALVPANRLIGEYVAACGQRPPGDVIAHVGRVVKKLLGEGIGPEHVRAGLRRYAEIQGHPSRLPSLVNDAMNAPAGPVRPGIRPAVSAHTAWTNPADPAAYAEEL
ncbi:hypothetical protein [Streptomyces sp. HPF1205]|uniref:hypothetical protein n=1 Tax=Streptomyces sp. HPF1205 TaxID=2873262 RepID=UPI001CED67A9|nr:hypothetical protein [Streptomyces sp. HPF1205]